MQSPNSDRTSPAVSGMRRVVDIERWLQQVYRIELAKGIPLAEGQFLPSREPRTRNMFDVFNNPGGGNFGPAPYPESLDRPHADAVRTHEAVERLASLALDDADPDVLGEDLAGLGCDARAAIERALLGIAGTIQMHARLKSRPAIGPTIPKRDYWGPVLRPTYPETGGRHPVVTKHHNGRGYPEGAAAVITYDPPLDVLLEDRAAYYVWWVLLDRLAEELAGKLETVRPIGPSAAQRPWAGDKDIGKIIPDLSPPRPAPQKTQRPLAGPPLRTPPFGPVRRIDPETGREAA